MLKQLDRQYLKIAIPASLEGVFMTLLASADLIMVGMLSTESVAAVGIFFQPRLIILTFSRSLAAALTLHVARASVQNRERIGPYLQQTLFLGVVLMGAIHLFFLWQLPEILVLMGAQPDYLAEAVLYGRISCAALFLISMTLILQAVSLGCGRTDSILKANAAGNVANVIADYILIFGWDPIPAFGIAGAAWATVLGTSLSLFLALVELRALALRLQLHFHGPWLPEPRFLRSLARSFAGVLTEQGSNRIAMVFFTRMVSGLGTLPLAVHSICMTFCDIYYDFSAGLGKASMVLAGQSLSRRDPDLWHRCRSAGVRWVWIFSTISFVLTLCFREEIFRLFSRDGDALLLALPVLVLAAVVSYPEAFALAFAGILQGSGRVISVGRYTFVSMILRLTATAFFLYVLNLGLPGAWYALLLDQGFRAACSYFLVRHMNVCAAIREQNDLS
ncbi:MAG: hypothetical protein ACFWT7_00520 [Succiniclasticum sp.]